MITRIFLVVKHRLPIVWRAVEAVNGVLYRVLHGATFDRETTRVLSELPTDGVEVRRLDQTDVPALSAMISAQGDTRLTYFQPHGFSAGALRRMLNNRAFVAFGVFDNSRLVGYFFLRCFLNKKCFVGRLIDTNFEGRGIGRVMNKVMYNIAWSTGFRCLTTVSRNNAAVMRSHANNPHARIVSELPNDYLLVEFVERGGTGIGRAEK